MLNKIIFLITILFLIQFTVCDKLKCGVIYDGLTDGKFDLQTQYSNSTISANWVNFSDDVLFHEWAIASDKINLQAFRNGGCIKDFRIIPDVQNWKTVKQNSGINTKLHLQVGTTYYNLLRTTFRSGEILFSVSNGVEIISSEFRTNSHFIEFNIIPEAENKKLAERNADIIVQTCPIDDSNQCRNAKVSVGERLNEIYGAPGFLTDQLVELVVYGSIDRENHGDDDDDDDDQAPAWILAPVIVGSFLFYCCILLLALLGILLFRRASPAEERESTNVSFENKKEAKSYGQREGMDVVDATTETRVEFPDTVIRRLSISHDTNPPLDDLGVAEESGRGRKHPIMSSASSSFRDYRSSVSH